MAQSYISVDVSKIPDVIAELRLAMAKLLREEAEGETELVRKFAQRVAADFEAGRG